MNRERPFVSFASSSRFIFFFELAADLLNLLYPRVRAAFSLMRTFRLLSVCAQPYAPGGTTLQAKPLRRFRAGELSMSLVIAWLRASSPIRRFPDRAAPCAEWLPKFCPASAAPISLRPGALWKAQWRWLVSSNALHASPRGFLRFPRGRIHRPVWRRTSLRAHRGAPFDGLFLRHD